MLQSSRDEIIAADSTDATPLKEIAILMPPATAECLTGQMSDTKVALMKTELVTTLKRQATKLIAGLQERKAPILIMQYGKPAAYLVDVASYEEMNRRISVLEGLALGEQAVRQGRIVSHTDAKKRLARWLS